MPATTCSQSKQAHTDKLVETKAAVTGSRRKTLSFTTQLFKPVARTKHVKDSKPSHTTPKDDKPESKSTFIESQHSILINRGPVLELWAAAVTSFLYSGISWKACLSAGSAILSLCAISKGRAVGTVERPNSSATETKSRQWREIDKIDELEVMRLHLKMKEDKALVGEKPKGADEPGLVKSLEKRLMGGLRVLSEKHWRHGTERKRISMHRRSTCMRDSDLRFLKARKVGEGKVCWTCKLSRMLFRLVESVRGYRDMASRCVEHFYPLDKIDMLLS
jgi:hypothetical protein